MKTIGEIIHASRVDRSLSEQQLSGLTRIDVKYIQALEENDFQKLPSATFTKGFVRNLAQALGKNPDEWVALLRRDYQAATIPTTPLSLPRRRAKFSLASLFQSQMALLLLGSLVFVIYLGFQYRAVITPPALEVINPLKDAVTISPITIEGKTASGTTITINDDLKITPDSSGYFAAKLNFSPGQNEVKVSVTNRFSRTTTKVIPITILSQ
ncbi:MAG: helix-turn-helix domain-containing protein [Patescibacteria group bacterium]